MPFDQPFDVTNQGAFLPETHEDAFDHLSFQMQQIADGEGIGSLKVLSVAGRAGEVVLTKADVGLSNADNTSDASKPISTPQQAALNLKADLVNGLVPTSQLPAVTIGETFTVNSQAAMLALAADGGDVAIRTDLGNDKYMLLGVATNLADWTLLTGGGAVDSVNGQVGVVELGKGDIGLANVDNTTDLNKPVSTAQAAANTADRARANQPAATCRHDPGLASVATRARRATWEWATSTNTGCEQAGQHGPAGGVNARRTTPRVKLAGAQTSPHQGLHLRRRRGGVASSISPSLNHTSRTAL